MRYQIDVKSDKEKEFLQIMKALKNLRVVKSFRRAGNNKGKEEKEMEEDVTSREMANQYRDLVD